MTDASQLLQKQIVAVFDFDGTLTYHDSLLPFLIFIVGPFKTFLALATKLPILIGFLFGRHSRQNVKEKILTSLLGGMSAALVQEKGKEFAQKKLGKLLRPDGMKRLRWHQHQRHRCILISANLDVYLHPWSLQENFNDLLCSNLQIVEGKITGFLNGKNCRGPEKTKRLLELLGNRENFVLYAYGDSPGDKELLQMADYPFYRTFDERTLC